MIEFRQQARLARELTTQTMIVGEAFFERDRDVQPPIDGLINCAHAAAAEPLHNSVAALQSRISWQKRRPRVGLQRLLHLGDRGDNYARWSAGLSFYLSKSGEAIRRNRKLEESKYDLGGGKYTPRPRSRQCPCSILSIHPVTRTWGDLFRCRACVASLKSNCQINQPVSTAAQAG